MRGVLLLLPLCVSCATFSWQRQSRHAPASSEAIARLEAGHSGLAQCLGEFGAPLWVWEHNEHGKAAAALAYGWFDEHGLGVSVSVPVSDSVSASLDYDQIDQRMKGLVLFFDADWTLTSWRTGLLRDLTQEARRPPTAVEEDA